MRFARRPDGVALDRRGRMPGRGAYVCPDPTCIEAAAKRGAGALRRALRGAPEAEARRALDTLRAEVATPTATADQGPDVLPQAEPISPPVPGDQVPPGTVRSHRT